MLPYKKEDLLDGKGRFLTQSLFLELEYNTNFAVFTLKENDYNYKGKLYPSLKRLYLEYEDITEYDFATTHLASWQHWKRLNGNKAIAPYIEDWREELELKIRSQAVRDIIDMTAEDKSFQAAKWLSDRGWTKREPGRPTKSEALKETRMQERIKSEFSGDVIRMKGV